MSAEYLDTAAFSTFDDVESGRLKEMAQGAGVALAVMDADGKLLFNSRVMNDDAQNAGDVALARANGTGTDTIEYGNMRATFASVLSERGWVVRVWAKAPTYAQVLEGHFGRFAFIAVVLIVLCYLLTDLSVRESDQLVQGMEGLFEAFAEGRFDARVELYGRLAPRVEKINANAARINEQLTRQSSRNQALSVVMNQMQNGLLAVNSDYEVILMTSVAKTRLGVHEPCEGKKIGEISKDVNLEPLFSEAMTQDGVYTGEIAVREGTTGRARTPLRLYISPMKRDGQIVGAVAMIEDITELRKLEQMRTDFTANVSHELKTPLTSIRGFVETLQAGAINNPEMAQKFLNIIMMEANRLTRLVNDILSISKLESGDTEVSLGRLRLDKMADDVCEMLKIHAKEKQVDLSINENGEPIYVWGNNDRVEQLLINLIENAIKYNQPGGTVRVSVYGTEKNAYLLVSDTGIGIAEEHIPRLFERFYRVDKGRSRSMGGTGLGLAIVKHIVVSMGGTIEVHSKLGEGTEFSVTLPRYTSTPAEEEATADDYSEEA
ncbi:MAG: ATP-binding protein [Eubacteriales bacterium]|nr:ATP-binding protein [Eubacteriales bacterium]